MKALLLSLEKALDQRDEARSQRKHACTERDRAVDALEMERVLHLEKVAALQEMDTKASTMILGFENTSKVMVNYSNVLETKLKVISAETQQLKEHATSVEERNKRQELYIDNLLQDFQKQKQRYTNVDVSNSVDILRTKQKEKAAFQTIIDKLSSFAESCSGAESMDPRKLSSSARSALIDVKTFAKDQELPKGWQVAVSPEGITYYVNHNQQTTTWAHPGLDDDSQRKDQRNPADSKVINKAPSKPTKSGRGKGSNIMADHQAKKAANVHDAVDVTATVSNPDFALVTSSKSRQAREQEYEQGNILARVAGEHSVAAQAWVTADVTDGSRAESSHATDEDPTMFAIHLV